MSIGTLPLENDAPVSTIKKSTAAYVDYLIQQPTSMKAKLNKMRADFDIAADVWYAQAIKDGKVSP
jgi:hypothetical protein